MTLPAPLEQRAKKSESNSREKKSRCDDITEDADVGVAVTGKLINRE